MNPKSIDNKTPFGETKKNLLEEITREDVIKELAMPEKNIAIQPENSSYADQEIAGIYVDAKWTIFQSEEILIVRGKLIQEKEGKKEDLGNIELYFAELADGRRIAYPNRLDITKQKQGLGLEIASLLEVFCRKHKIQTIYKTASSEEGDVGAYVWSKYGYEFVDDKQREELAKRLYFFALKKKVVLSQNMENLKKPLDFAQAMGISLVDGKETDIGKQFLLDGETMWYGKKNLASDNQEFLSYLKKRGRSDLVEKLKEAN